MPILCRNGRARGRWWSGSCPAKCHRWIERCAGTRRRCRGSPSAGLDVSPEGKPATQKETKTKDTNQFEFWIFFKLCLHFYFLLSSFSRSLGLWTSLKNNNRNKKTKTQSRPLASIKQTVTGGPSTTQSDHLRTFSLLFLNFVFQGSKNIKSDGPNVIDKNEKAAVAGQLKDQAAAIWT